MSIIVQVKYQIEDNSPDEEIVGPFKSLKEAWDWVEAVGKPFFASLNIEPKTWHAKHLSDPAEARFTNL